MSSSDDWDANVSSDEEENVPTLAAEGPEAPAARVWRRGDAAFVPASGPSSTDENGIAQLNETRQLSDSTQIAKFIQSLKDDFDEDVLSRFDTKSDDYVSRLYQTISCGHRQIGHDTNKPFLVDLDSLLMDVFADPLLDWKFGGEFLQVIFLVEQALVRLSSGERALSVVMFDALSVLWSDTTMLLARNIVFLHLKNETKIRCECFDGWWDAKFKAFSDEIRPSFILVSDGDAHSQIKTPVYCMQIFQRLTLHLLSCGISCVRCTEVFYYSNALYGFRLEMPNVHQFVHEGMISQCIPEISAEPVAEPDLDLLNRLRELQIVRESPRFLIVLYGCIVMNKRQQNDNSKLLKQFLTHSIVQTCLDLKYRSFREEIYQNDDPDLKSFASRFCCAVIGILDHCARPELVYSCDVFDGRLFRVISHLSQTNPALPLSGEALRRLDMLYQVVNDQISRVDTADSPLSNGIKKPSRFSSRSTQAGSSRFGGSRFGSSKFEAKSNIEEPVTEVVISKSSPSETCAVHRIHSAVVDEIVPDLEKTLASDGLVVQSEPDPLPLPEHWHEKVLIPDGLRKKSEILNEAGKDRKRLEKGDQRYLAFMKKYSDSLAGSKIVLRDVIVSQKSSKKHPNDPGQKVKGVSGKGQKRRGKGKNVRQESIKNKTTLRQKAQAKDDMIRYIELAAMIPTLEGKISKLDEKLLALSDPVAALPGQLKLLEWCMESYRISQPDLNKDPAIRLFQTIHDIFRRFKIHMQISEVQALQTGLHLLGFNDSAKQLALDYVQLMNETHPKKTSLGEVLVSPNSYDESKQCEPVGISCRRFQLDYAGHLMVRNVESKPDPRVENFYPDKWQRDLLDVVDEKRSCLVVAPTSSGKTFISYYTMKKILFDNRTVKRSKDQGFVVFVCPTKALVNQVAADVFRRWGRIFGIYTMDYDMWALDCEVLITVPEGLERMLMAPQREQFAKQLRYVIFDEVHSIGNPTGGEIWERIILMLQCPFVALSATLGNPDSFHAWLQRVQNIVDRRGSRRTEVSLITHTERWSDLEKYMYVPKEMFPEISSLNLGGGLLTHSTSSICSIHPLGAYQLGNGLQRGQDLPADLVFSPKDCSTLFDVMIRVVSRPSEDFPERKELVSSMGELDPEVFFSPLCITKRQVSDYESQLKKQLVRWSELGLHEEIQTVLAQISADLRKEISRTEQIPLPTAPELESVRAASLDEYVNPYSPDFVNRHFLPLLMDLDSTDRIPAIVFSMDNESCERLVIDTLDRLEAIEEKVLKEDGGRKRVKDQKDRRKALKAQKRLRDAKKRKGKRQEGGDDEQPRAEDGLLPEAEAEKEVDLRFSFCRPGEMMNQDDVDYWVKRTLYKQSWKKNHPLIRCLARGIGVHHDGLSRQYRSLVEAMFRARHLKVVVTTETLSLGVNMPCRTTVFAGDSPKLTPLRYRQMMGRSGRRGYDNVGHVIFLGIPPHKISYLMTSSLLSLHGNFAMSTTSVLRALISHSEADDKKFRLRSIANLLQETFSPPSQNSAEHPLKALEVLKKQIGYHYRFSLEYLVQIGLIDCSGQTAGAAGLVSHLYASNPANFAFAVLLQSGIFDSICSGFSANINVVNDSKLVLKLENKAICREVLGILCHLFFRVPFPANFKKSINSLSHVVMSPLCQEAQAVLARHNQTTVALFTQYCRTFSRDCLGAEDPSLPMSGVKFSGTPISDTDDVSSPLVEEFKSSAREFHARSPFVALSGHTDSFLSGQEIMETVNHQIKIGETDFVPTIELKDARRRELPLNAYALDFFIHGAYARLLKDNSLVEGYAWDLLKEWSLILKSIKLALTYVIVDAESDKVFLTFTALSNEFKRAFDDIGSQHAVSRSE
uniref:ATP-dependent RNA helicase DDX60 isoform X1 n=2 Tax=Hirondellea gigas TaxID=1518452 RepID=A0A6A7G030_9CRUS